jgi:predicted membrane protein
MFGGVGIDLRQAGIRGDSAVIDVTSMFGGVEFKVPTNWIVVGHVFALFGGFGNKTVQPSADMPGVKRLYIKGSAMFGGVEVKN